MTSVHVKRIVPSTTGPIVTSFTQGPPPLTRLTVPLAAGGGGAGGGVSGGQEMDQPLTLKYRRGLEGKRVHQRQLTAEGESVVYTATNYGPQATQASSGYRYAVCVLSKKRGRLDVYEADGGGVVFGLEADATKGLVALLGDAPLKSQLEGMDVYAKRDALVASFGSQKKKKMEASRKANIVNVEGVAGASEVSANAVAASSQAAKGKTTAAAAAAAAAGDGEGELGAPTTTTTTTLATSTTTTSSSTTPGATVEDEARARLFPPYNPYATAPQDAFPLEGLIPPPVSDSLSPYLTPLLKAVRALVKSGAMGTPGSGATPNHISITHTPSIAACLPPSALASAFAGECLGSLLAEYSAGVVDKGECRRRVLCCLYAAHLVALSWCEKVVKVREVKVEIPHGASGSGSGSGSGGAEGEGEGEGEAAPAAASSTHVTYTVMSHGDYLKDTPVPLLAYSLARFTEPRDRDTGFPYPFSPSNPLTVLSRGAKYVRSEECTKRLKYHAAVAALTAAGFAINLGALADDFRVTPSAFVKVFRDLGCEYKTEVGSKGGKAGRKGKGKRGGEEEGEGGEGEGEGEGGEPAEVGLSGKVTSYVVKLKGPPQFKTNFGARGRK